MKYRCLVLDHDDTVVKSTPEIHYPSFVEIMRALRSEEPIPTLQEFMEFCSEPGYFAHCRDVIRFTPQESVVQDQMWHDYVASHISEEKIVLRDYEAQNLPRPALVFGAELGEDRRKPNPWPLFEIRRRLKIPFEETAMVDDLMTGLSMAKNCGVMAVAAGWSHISPKIADRVRRSCDVYCKTVEELRTLLLKEKE